MPKRSRESGERTDTRVLEAIYALDPAAMPVYVGQQVDVFIDAANLEAMREAQAPPRIRRRRLRRRRPRPPAAARGRPAAFASFDDARLDADAEVDSRWWRSLGDATLSGLVERALVANPDARIAAARVVEARALVDVVAADRLRSSSSGRAWSASGRARRRARLDVEPEPAERPVPRRLPGVVGADLFGPRAARRQAAQADSAPWSPTATRSVALSGEVGRAYVDLLGARRELEALAADESSAADTVALTRSRSRGGLATGSTSRAPGGLATIRSQIPERRATESRALHRLAVLVGQQPGSLDAELATARTLPVPAPRIAVGIPARCSRDGPTCAAPSGRSPRRRRASASRRPTSIPTSPSRPRSGSTRRRAATSSRRRAAPGRSDRRCAGRSSRAVAPWRASPDKTRAHAAAAQFDRTVLAALAEVGRHDRVSPRVGLPRAVRVEVEADRRAVVLARDVQRAGAGTFLDVLDVERRVHEAEVRLAQSDAAVAGNVVALHSALAGGWSTELPILPEAIQENSP
jgi:outer membrane protein TolC